MTEQSLDTVTMSQDTDVTRDTDPLPGPPYGPIDGTLQSEARGTPSISLPKGDVHLYLSKYKAGKYSTKAENRAPSRTESTGLHCSTVFRDVGRGETAM